MLFGALESARVQASRRMVGVTASERALANACQGRLKCLGAPTQTHMRDDALIAHLGKENKPEAFRFRTWIERNIALPGRRVRQNFGIRVDTEGSTGGDGDFSGKSFHVNSKNSGDFRAPSMTFKINSNKPIFS